MKKTILFAAMAALIMFTSCNKDEMNAPASSKAVIDVNLVSASSATKATGTVNTNATGNQTAGEQKVNSLQVFVFAGDVRDGYANVSNAESAEVECTVGSRDIYAVVNAPSLSSVTSKSELMATVSELSESAASFQMFGGKTAQNIGAQRTSIDLGVSRIASKIVLKSIVNNLRAGGALTVKRVYITNVAGQINFGGDAYAPASGKWYNKGGYQASNNLGSFTQDVNLSANVAAGASYSTNHYFYAYPNNYAFSEYSAAGWSPRRTLLVVQIEYNGSLYDYPVDLGVDLKSNKMYVINSITLNSLGNPDDGSEGGADEGNPVVKSSAEVSIDVLDWDVVLLGEGGDFTI